jgi:DNA-binding NarL/FixJ family response regulator
MTANIPSGNALTPKEIQIGILVRRCLRNRDIAETLGISEQDVKNRLRGIFDKVGVWSRVELAMHVLEHPEKWHADKETGKIKVDVGRPADLETQR